MKKCIVCGERLDNNNFCKNCLSDSENLKEKIYRKINDFYSGLSLVIYPIICFSIIYQIKSFKNFINSIEFYAFLTLIIATISNWYRLIYEKRNIERLQSQYKYIKSKLK